MACVTSVTEKLISLDEVQDLKIDLAEGNVTLEVSKNIDIRKIDCCVAPKVHTFVERRDLEAISQKWESLTKLKQLFPLLLIFVYLILGSILIQKDFFVLLTIL